MATLDTRPTKSYVVDGDWYLISDSENSLASKKVTQQSIRTQIQNFQAYMPTKATLTNSDIFMINDSASSFVAKQVNYGTLKTYVLDFQGLTPKATLASNDYVPITDVSSGFVTKIVTGQTIAGLVSNGAYQSKGIFSDTSIKIYPYAVNCGGAIYSNATTQTIISISSLIANTWYAVVIKENDGSLGAVPLNAGWDNLVITGNQLNLLSIYNQNYNYCRDSRAGFFYRILGVFKTNAGPTSVTSIFNILNRPKTMINVSRSTTQAFTSATPTKIQYDTINYDLNSEWDSINYQVKIKGSTEYRVTLKGEVTAGYNNGQYCEFIGYINGTTTGVIAKTFANGTYNNPLFLSGTNTAQGFAETSYLEIYVNATGTTPSILATAGALTTLSVIGSAS